jgi:hypothetical protein
MRPKSDIQPFDADESIPIPHSRRDMLKLAGTVGAASLGATALVDTAAATSEASPDTAAFDATGEATLAEDQSGSGTPDTFTPVEYHSEDVEAQGEVVPGCIEKTGTPGVTILCCACARHAYDNSWTYAGYILDHYPGLDACRTQLSVAGEIEAHQRWQENESITLGCGGD